MEYIGKLIEFLKDWKNQSKYFAWLVKCSKPFIPQLLLLMVLGLTDTILSVGLAVIIKDIIDDATQEGIVLGALILYIGLVLINRIVSALHSFLSFVVNEKFTFGIRKQIYNKVMKSYWYEIKKYHTGDLLTRLTNDVDIISDGVTIVLPAIIRLFLELLVTFFTLYYYEHSIALFALLIAPVAGIIGLVLGRKLKKIQVKVQESESKYRSYIQESISNILIVKSFVNEVYATQRLTENRNERLFWLTKKNKIGIMYSSILSLSFQFGYIGALTIGVFQLANGAITFGTMSIFLTLVNRIQSPIFSLANLIPSVVSVLASAGRIMELNNVPIEKELSANINLKEVGLDMEQVSFGYTDEMVLEEVSISIKPSEMVAILGTSGIGKTTLVRILMSFLNNSNGTIKFWNNIYEYEFASANARKNISYVPQGNTLFSGTIRDNILMGKLDASDEEIYEALELSASSKFVNELPHGIHTILGESGHGVSEGQAQRIAIARALIRKAPFLILDEATSALDETTELYVLEGIQKMIPRPTCLIITHRKSILKFCDRELEIVNKKICEKEINR